VPGLVGIDRVIDRADARLVRPDLWGIGMASFVDHYEPRGSHSKSAYVIDRIIAVCGIVPYALVALCLRLIVARGLFLYGQSQVDGSTIPLMLHGFDFSLILPEQIRAAALQSIAAQFGSAAVSPTIIAYSIGYGAFVLPICLVIGFATRIAALLLLVMTILLAVYVQPAALWTTYIYWGAMLLVLMTCGAGPISLDGLIRYCYRKSDVAEA
jgi:putative oxidoreductase